MNKWQKEVQQHSLNSEKEVLKQIKNNYEEAIRTIDANIAQLLVREDADMQHVIYQIEYQKAMKKQNEAILIQLQENNFQTVSEYLSACYEDGFIGAMYDLQGQGIPLIIPIDQEQVVQAVKTQSKLSTSLYDAFDIKDLQKQISAEISRGISSQMTFGEIAKNVSNRSGVSLNNAIRIARTEGHRIQCTAQMHGCEKAKSRGADIVKQWDSTLDAKTRDSHKRLDGQIREIDEPFEIDGMTAMHPSDFGDPSEDINCRCVCNQRARWGLDEDELQTLKERAEYFDLDKTDDFEDFKEKYLKAQDAERVRMNEQMMKYDLQLFALKDEALERKTAEFQKAFESGEINTNIRRQKQNEHIEGTKERQKRIQHDMENEKTPSSYFYEKMDVESIITKNLNTGFLDFSSESQKFPTEYVQLENPVGKVYNIGKEEYVDVSRIGIKYGTDGVHAYPVKDW